MGTTASLNSFARVSGVFAVLDFHKRHGWMMVGQGVGFEIVAKRSISHGDVTATSCHLLAGIPYYLGILLPMIWISFRAR